LLCRLYLSFEVQAQTRQLVSLQHFYRFYGLWWLRIVRVLGWVFPTRTHIQPHPELAPIAEDVAFSNIDRFGDGLPKRQRHGRTVRTKPNFRGSRAFRGMARSQN
jgi:hypothetical protein